MINVTEGEVGQLCVTIQDDDALRERSVGIAFSLYPMSKQDTTCACKNKTLSVCIIILILTLYRWPMT